jgi:stage V sporulation protein R
MGLPRYLADWQRAIEAHASAYGLDFFRVIFEVLSYDAIHMVAAYGGFPTRYPHWRFGMEYERLKRSYEYGLAKIYEMVINNDPCYAYLLEGNSLVDQKIVMAHVYAHCDFFKNNLFFRDTHRQMMNEMANHATRVRRHMARLGTDEVESFIDTALSLENLIDVHAPHIRRQPVELAVEEDELRRAEVPRLRADRKYLEPFVNPAEYLEKQKARLADEQARDQGFPSRPERDVLAFLLEHAPLKSWQRDILGIVREEAVYFAPQGQTKIMNEGWASYWHSTIMTQKVLNDAEVIDFADHHAGTLGVRPGALNPYKLGIELFRYIEHKWNTGRFGKEYAECDDLARKRAWDKRLNLGREKIFEVRQIHNDVTFIDEFLDEEFCHTQKLFGYDFNPRSHNWEITTRNFREVKQKLLFQLTNFGQPIIEVLDANHMNRGELVLRHRHEGVDLKQDWAQSTLEALFRVWSRPVLVETVVEERPSALRYDGREHTSEKIAG